MKEVTTQTVLLILFWVGPQVVPSLGRHNNDYGANAIALGVSLLLTLVFHVYGKITRSKIRTLEDQIEVLTKTLEEGYEAPATAKNLVLGVNSTAVTDDLRTKYILISATTPIEHKACKLFVAGEVESRYGWATVEMTQNEGVYKFSSPVTLGEILCYLVYEDAHDRLPNTVFHDMQRGSDSWVLPVDDSLKNIAAIAGVSRVEAQEELRSLYLPGLSIGADYLGCTVDTIPHLMKGAGSLGGRLQSPVYRESYEVGEQVLVRLEAPVQHPRQNGKYKKGRIHRRNGYRRLDDGMKTAKGQLPDDQLYYAIQLVGDNSVSYFKESDIGLMENRMPVLRKPWTENP